MTAMTNFKTVSVVEKSWAALRLPPAQVRETLMEEDGLFDQLEALGIPDFAQRSSASRPSALSTSATIRPVKSSQ